MWKEYTNAFLGLCVVVVAFFGVTDVVFAWTLGILGSAILVLGLWGAMPAASTELEQRHA